MCEEWPIHYRSIAKVRASLGASRFRLVRQLLVESFILSAASCILGCFLAYLGLKAVVAVLPSDGVPPNAVIALNPRALLFAMGISTLTTLLCGLIKALRARGSEHGAQPCEPPDRRPGSR